MTASPRLAVRALIVQDGALLLVNAWPGRVPVLWCAPGGGVDLHASLHETLIREVREETGLSVEPGALALVNEFHDPGGDFHQVELFFHARVTAGRLDPAWRDPEGIVTERRFFTRAALAGIEHKPAALAEAAFGGGGGALHDPLEPLVR